MRILLSVIFLLFLTFPCVAQDSHGPVQSYKCPDEVQCKQRLYNNVSSNSSDQTIGTIHDVKCCYKFPTGCRPWHCDGDKTNQEYWMAKCDETFPECKSDHAGYTDPFCTAHFKSYF
jgi:hypothetical protein